MCTSLRQRARMPVRRVAAGVIVKPVAMPVPDVVVHIVRRGIYPLFPHRPSREV